MSAVSPVATLNGDGHSPFVILCDHASNHIPAEYRGLGLGPIERLSHIAWDPGALAVSLELMDALDAPLVHATTSRLVVDCNRRHDTPDLMPAVSETTVVPGNATIEPAERKRRIEAYHRPYHAAIEALLAARALAGRPSLLVCMHSFTPSYKGVARPWEIGILPARNERLSQALFAAVVADAPELNVGWNEPYSTLNGVTYTVEHHGDGRGLDATMIEIRNDEILEPNGVRQWAARLARCLETARQSLPGASANEPAPGTGGAEQARGTAVP